MSDRIYMRVFIDNQSDAILKRSTSELSSGSFTSGWHPPTSIDPGQRVGFQGEGDLLLTAITGTEGRVRYQIVGSGHSGELYIHWNSPLIESPYGNTFHVWAPSGWEVSHRGGQGKRGQLEVRLRRSDRRSVPHFHPKTQGFAFCNKWDSNLPATTIGSLWNRLLDTLPGPLGELGIAKVDEAWLPITSADAGMCGGMVFAAMDYHHFNLLPPTHTAPPTSLNDVLFQHIRERLVDSFDLFGQGHRYLAYSSPHYPNGDEGVFQNILGLTKGRSWITYREEWPRIQADIDGGMLSPVALIQTSDLNVGNNHQVLAYAYRKDGQRVTLYVYDPNTPGEEVSLGFDVTSTSGEVHVEHSKGGEHRIWAFFRTNNYAPKEPPGGRRITTVRDALAASAAVSPPFSIRAAMSRGPKHGTVRKWVRSW